MTDQTLLHPNDVFGSARMARLVAMAALLVLGPGTLPAAVTRASVDHDYVDRLARDLAAKPYVQPRNAVPERLRELTGTEHARIRFRPEQALWVSEGLPFQVEFDHLGADRLEPKEVFEFSATHVQEVPFARRYFDYGDYTPSFWSAWRLNYAGVRLFRRAAGPDGKTAAEIAAFGDGGELRARVAAGDYGVVMHLVAPGTGELGPVAFERLWLGKPAADDETLTVHGLLNGPDVVVACTFVIEAGQETVVDVHSTFHFRRELQGVGLIALSGGFWFGENSANRFGDYRGEVHTVDGLLIGSDALRRVWRPLVNPERTRTSVFETPALGGFGLVQRDRDFRSYQDMEARFQARPGLWIEPVAPWPAGRIFLSERPAPSEPTDNVMAYWVPTGPLSPKEPLELRWKQRWSEAASFGGPPARVVATRQTVRDGGARITKFVVDFAADAGALPAAEGDGVTMSGEALSPGRVLEQSLKRLPDGSGWRVVLRAEAPPDATAVDLRARLFLAGRQVSETWTYRWEP